MLLVTQPYSTNCNCVNEYSDRCLNTKLLGVVRNVVESMLPRVESGRKDTLLDAPVFIPPGKRASETRTRTELRTSKSFGTSENGEEVEVLRIPGDACYLLSFMPHLSHAAKIYKNSRFC